MNLSLRGQILVYTLATSLLAMSCIAFFTYQREGGREKEEARLECLSKSNTAANMFLEGSNSLEKDRLQNKLHILLENKRILSGRIYDLKGAVIAEVRDPEAMPLKTITLDVLQSIDTPQALFNPDQIDVLQALKTKSGQAVGYLSISYTLESLNEHISMQFYDTIYSLLLCLLLAIIASIVFSSWIVKPLRELMDKANRIIQGENIPLTLERKDELGSLALSLNTMLRYINTRDDNLRNLAASLEQKVVLRTEELGAALENAEAATQAKAAFLASMTHELRTPMNGVIGTASLLADTELTADQREKLNIIQSCGGHLLTVINDILDVSKIEASKMELEYAPLDLHQLIKSALNIVSPMTSAKDLIIDSFVDEHVPPFIEGDVVRLRQVLVNLMSNAIKFTDNGGIYISVKSPRENTLEVAIRDTGIGISEESQKKLFNAFTQADSSMTRKYGGTGLGLTICKKLIELMGGEIIVTSVVGEGSTFSFTIPVKAIDSMPKELIDQYEVQPSRLGVDKPMKILLAEDNLVNQMVAKGFLQKLGYKPDVASNGLEALAALKQKDYDLIFMDMMMPEMDGLEATKIICSQMPVQSRPWIVAMTANAMEEHKKQCVEAGMNDFLTKPFTVEGLASVLRAAPCVIKADGEQEAPVVIEAKAEAPALKKENHDYKAIDKQKIFDNFKDDIDLVPFAIEAFMKDYPLRIADMEQSIKNDNASQLALAAHTLRGAVSNFYAPEAVGYAYTLEKSAKDNDLTEANQNFDNLKAELEKVHQDLEFLLAEMS